MNIPCTSIELMYVSTLLKILRGVIESDILFNQPVWMKIRGWMKSIVYDRLVNSVGDCCRSYRSAINQQKNILYRVCIQF